MQSLSRKKNTTKIFIATTILAAIIFGLSSHFLSQNGDVVVAKVNNQKIYQKEVQRKLRAIFAAQSFGSNPKDITIPELDALPQEVIEVLVKEVYLSKILVKKAKKHHLDKSPQTKEQINNILRQKYIDHVIETKVTDEALNNKYVEISNELAGKKEYLIHHILVKTQKEADWIKRRVRTAATFKQYAAKHSLDTNSGKNNGQLGYVIEENMLKEIADVIALLKKDQVSQPIKTKFGWHLVKFSDVRDAKAPDFEDIKDNLRQQLAREVANEVNTQALKDANIKILIDFNKEEADEELGDNEPGEKEETQEQKATK